MPSENTETDKMFNRVTDYLYTVVSPVKLRLLNPFIGSFAISWVLVNWKPIFYFILSSSTVEAKLDYIEDHFYPNLIMELNNYLLWPMIVSFLYAFGLKRLSLYIDTFNRPSIDGKDDFDHSIKLAKYNHAIQYAEKEAEIVQKRAHYKTIEQQTQQIETLKLSLIKKDEEISDLLEKNEQIMGQIANDRNKNNEMMKQIQNGFNEEISQLVETLSRKDDELKRISEEHQERNAEFYKLSESNADLRHSVHMERQHSMQLENALEECRRSRAKN